MKLNDYYFKCVKEAQALVKEIGPANTSTYFFPARRVSIGGLSPYCCGFFELTTFSLLSNFKHASVLAKEDQWDLHLAWCISRALGPVGLLIYNCPDEKALDRDPYIKPYVDFANALQRFGFTKIVSYPNPNHNYRKVDLLICQSELCSTRPNSSDTILAPNVVAKIISDSTATAAPSVSAATGSSRRKTLKGLLKPSTT